VWNKEDGVDKDKCKSGREMKTKKIVERDLR
jgi:hypothetical protein